MTTPVKSSRFISILGTTDIRKDEYPCLNHAYERYLHKNDIMHSLCKVRHSQSNGKIENFYLTHEKHLWQIETRNEFLTFYNEKRPRMSLDWDNLEAATEASDRLYLSPTDHLLETEMSTEEQPTKSLPYSTVRFVTMV